MISSQNLVYQFLTGQIETAIKSIHIETWSPLHTPSITSHFNNIYNTEPRPVLLISSLLPCYHSPPSESNNARRKFYSTKRICNHFNRNQKRHRHINRYNSFRCHQTYTFNSKFIDNTGTNVRTIARTQNEPNGPEQYETASIRDENPFYIYTAVDNEMVELL
jgi:hypothetical protein